MTRWNHKDVARRHNVAEDVVRRIYAAVQTAKKQGLHGGHYVDCVERNVGRKLVGAEYTVSSLAKEHLGYEPTGGYLGSPEPKGICKVGPKVNYDDPKARSASEVRSDAESVIKSVLSRFRFMWAGRDEAKDRDLLRHAADELDVAADLYEDAGAKVRAGTLRERAAIARRGDYELLKHYE
jgi:hypothetical protein